MCPQKLLGVASVGRVGYKENLASGKSVFKDLKGSCVGTVHLATLPPPQASGCLSAHGPGVRAKPPALH